MGGGRSGEEKKIVSGLIEFVISLAVPDRWIHEYCLDALCLSGAVVSKDKQWDAGLSDWGKWGRAPL